MSRPPKPSIAISGWIGSTNLGDELVHLALRRKLDARAVFPQPLSRSGTRSAFSSVGPGALRAIRASGGMLLGGGGLLQDETSPWNLPYHLAPALAASAMSVPWGGIGLGAGPLVGGLGRRLVSTTMRRAVAISVRDRASQDVLTGLGVGSRLAADLALSLPAPVRAPEDLVVVCLRPWSGRRSMTPVSWRRHGAIDLPEPFLQGMAEGLDELSIATGLGVHFVAFQRDRDHDVHLNVAGRMQIAATTSTPTLDGILSEVARARLVVAMRYHAGLAAALAGRPAVLISYSAKVPALAEDLGPAAEALAWSASAPSEVPVAAARVLPFAPAMPERLEVLRRRERVNDDVIDRLLETPRSAPRG